MTDILPVNSDILASVEHHHEERELERFKDSGFIFTSERKADFEKDCQEERRRCVSTGFQSLDRILGGGLYPGVYPLGGPTGTGKTALAMQIAGHVAINGGEVFIISLEIDPLTLIARDLSRLNRSYKGAPYTPDQIRLNSWKGDQAFQDLKNTYFERIGSRQVIFAPDFLKEEMTIDHLAEKITKYYESRKAAPTLIICDYLQIMPAYSEGMTDKQKIDSVVKALGSLARSFNAPILVLSAYARGSANLSGSAQIEYSGEGLLKLSVFKDEEDKKDKAKLDDYEVKRQCNEHDRIIPLVLDVEKNRHGIEGRLYFTFEGAFALYTEASEERLKNIRKAAREKAKAETSRSPTAYPNYRSGSPNRGEAQSWY